MSKSDTRKTVLEIVQEVQKKLGLDPQDTLIANKQTKVMLQFVNETVEEMSDVGDWQEQLRTVDVTAVAGQSEYGQGVSYPIKNVYEIAWDTRPQALYIYELQDVLRLQRASGDATGEPRMFCPKGVDPQGNPVFSCYPIPGATEDGLLFHVIHFEKPANYDNSSVDEEVPFPANVVILGTFWRMLLDENGGSNTVESQNVEKDYKRALEAALHRFNSDTGTDVQIQPVGYE